MRTRLATDVLTSNKLVVLLLFLVLGVPLSTGKVPRIRGVPLAKSSLYLPDTNFKCLDGWKIIPFNHVNDDYCDCPDASDEPGTAACPNGVFHCQNLGHQAKFIRSSFVNDGVCDCCDGSDEYSSNASCVDNCHELGQEAYLEAQKAAEIARQGHKIKVDLVSQGKQLKSEMQQKLEKLRNDHKEAEFTKKEKEIIKQQAEERETAALEKYKPPPPPEPKQRDINNEEKELEAEEYFRGLDIDENGVVDVVEIQKRLTFDKDKNGEVSREEALFFLTNREEVTLAEFQESSWNIVQTYIMIEKGLFKPLDKDDKKNVELDTDGKNDHFDDDLPDNIQEEDHDQEEYNHDADSEGDEQEEHDDEYDAGDIDKDHEPSQGDRMDAEPQYDEETQIIIDEAKQAREKYQEADKVVNDLLNEIRTLEGKVERDYGPEEEFAALDGECFDYTDLEYIYTLCLFDKATQKPKSGGSEINLGIWNNWTGIDEDKYLKMKYDRGLTCWNGPSRSTDITLKCGTENKVLSVTEPNRCEYAMEFSTPAICKINVETVDTHDEL